MKEFELCDIVVITAEHPIGVKSVSTQSELGIVAEIGRYLRCEKCYRVQNASRKYSEGYFYSADQIRLASEDEIREELQRLMLGN